MSVTASTGYTIEVHLPPEALSDALRSDAAAGLTASPKQLPPTWFYDERGCELFEQITELDEYYPTRTERAILTDHADDIVAAAGCDTLVELGSGTSDKTRLLLDALARAGRLDRFVPFDVAEPTLRAAATAITAEYPGTAVHAVVGDFREHLDRLPVIGRRTVAFLGGTVGNLRPDERHELLAAIASNLGDGDTLLLGTDLVKDPARLVDAYDDARGVTAAFNRNVLAVLNRELGADFDPDRFTHVACWDEEEEWIEMRLRSDGPQVVEVPELDLVVEFDDGEDLLTETSAKFRPERIDAELQAAGLDPIARWTDVAGDFALTLAAR